jgi:hypothetical protein
MNCLSINSSSCHSIINISIKIILGLALLVTAVAIAVLAGLIAPPLILFPGGYIVIALVSTAVSLSCIGLLIRKALQSGKVELPKRISSPLPHTPLPQTEKPVKASSFYKKICTRFHPEELLELALEHKMSQQPLTIEEQWYMRAIEGDLSITQAEYSSLSSQLQEEVFEIANKCRHIELVQKLRNFGARISPSLAMPKVGPALSRSMDIVEITETMTTYIDQLAQSGRLFTPDGFAQFSLGKKFRKKDRAFQRLLGHEHLQKVIDQLGVSSVKVPMKVGVATGNSINMIFRVERFCYFGAELTPMMYPVVEEEADDSKQDLSFEVYAEEIVPCKRKITRQEMEELLKVIIASNFSDLFYKNFIITKEAIYIIDTEVKSFMNEINPKKLLLLIDFLNSEDHEWFKEIVAEKTASFKPFSKQEYNENVSKEDKRCNRVFRRLGFFWKYSVPNPLL